MHFCVALCRSHGPGISLSFSGLVFLSTSGPLPGPGLNSFPSLPAFPRCLLSLLLSSFYTAANAATALVLPDATRCHVTNETGNVRCAQAGRPADTGIGGSGVGCHGLMSPGPPPRRHEGESLGLPPSDRMTTDPPATGELPGVGRHPGFLGPRPASL